MSRTDYIFDTATSDDGMNNSERARFHAFNPTGTVQRMPNDFTYTDPQGREGWALGAELIGGRHDNYHAKEIVRLAGLRRVRRFDLDFHIHHARKDAQMAVKVLADKRAGLL